MPYTFVPASNDAHLDALKTKHAKLSDRIETVQKRFFVDNQEIVRLKRQKLKIKEEIEGIRS